MSERINNTTRRYPRTLLEAFPTHYPNSVSRYKPLDPDLIVGLVCIFAAGFVLGLLVGEML